MSCERSAQGSAAGVEKRERQSNSPDSIADFDVISISALGPHRFAGKDVSLRNMQDLENIACDPVSPRASSLAHERRASVEPHMPTLPIPRRHSCVATR